MLLLLLLLLIVGSQSLQLRQQLKPSPLPAPSRSWLQPAGRGPAACCRACPGRCGLEDDKKARRDYTSSVERRGWLLGSPHYFRARRNELTSHSCGVEIEELDRANDRRLAHIVASVGEAIFQRRHHVLNEIWDAGVCVGRRGGANEQ